MRYYGSRHQELWIQQRCIHECVATHCNTLCIRNYEFSNNALMSVLQHTATHYASGTMNSATMHSWVCCNTLQHTMHEELWIQQRWTHDPFATCLIHFWDMNHSHVQHTATHMTHSYVCAMTHSYVWYDSFIYVTWPTGAYDHRAIAPLETMHFFKTTSTAEFSVPVTSIRYGDQVLHPYLHPHTHIHTYLSIYILTHTHMHTCIHAYIHTYIQTCIRAYVHTYIHTCMHACMHTCTQAFVRAYVRAYVRTYTYLFCVVTSACTGTDFCQLQTSIRHRLLSVTDLCQLRTCVSYGDQVLYTYLHAHTRTYTHTHIYTYVHTNIHTYMYTCIRVYVRRYVHVYVHAYISAAEFMMRVMSMSLWCMWYLWVSATSSYAHICLLHIYMHTYVHTYIQTCIHTYIHIQRLGGRGLFPKTNRTKSC